MKFISLFILSTFLTFTASAQSMKMQHGFILSADSSFASHLVASGHHSHQVSVTGRLIIENEHQAKAYRGAQNSIQENSQHYLLLQAQDLNIEDVQVGQTLEGHIIRSQIGDYQPQNKIVDKAQFIVGKVLLNIANPFFK